MDLHAIFIRSPINRLSAGVVSQRGAAEEDSPLTREELAYIVQRLSRKQRLLKRVLGIANRSQHKNMMWKANKRFAQYRVAREPRAFQEYRRIGREMQRLNAELSAVKKAYQAEWEAKHQPPNVKVTGLPQPDAGSDTTNADCGRSG